MKAASFTYHAPASLEEAVATLREHADEAKILAGGQSLVPMLALRLARFDHLVDLNRLPELQYVSADGGWLAIGAMTRQSAVERAGAVSELAPLLARAIPKIGHFQIRNRGTIGGSIAHADPASELPAVACALGAEIEVRNHHGVRLIPASEFFVSVWQTVLAADEIVTSLRFPSWGNRSGFAIEEIAWRTGDFAIAGVACAIGLDASGRVGRAGVALMGMGSTPLRASEAEAAMANAEPGSIDTEAVAELAVGWTSPSDDVHATGEYRKKVAKVLVRRALEAAIGEATGG